MRTTSFALGIAGFLAIAVASTSIAVAAPSPFTDGGDDNPIEPISTEEVADQPIEPINPADHSDTWDNVLIGRAILPADTFAKGPTSGQYIGKKAINGIEAPFINKQPVQGFSAVLHHDGDSYYALSDNGFGSQENSADYELRIYEIAPNFRSKDNKGKNSGTVGVNGYITLSDPNRLIPFPITNEFSRERILTGADFDIESFQQLADGSFYIGDEFGPYLLHVNKHGVLQSAPISLPDLEVKGEYVISPQNPVLEKGNVLRVLNAMRESSAPELKTKRKFVFSPWHLMLDDGNPDTYVPNRKNPSESRLKPASSEIFNVKAIQQAGYPVVVWTVNDMPRMTELIKLGVDGIISDDTYKLHQVVFSYDGDGDGKPDFVDEDGLIDPKLFSAQGHRGARDLRPENTLPAMEVALDHLMNTLESDMVLTKDHVVVLNHEPYLAAAKNRKLDGSAYEETDEILIKDIDFAELQETFITDKLLPTRGNQTNDLSLSPVAAAFAAAGHIPHAYSLPSVDQLFAFVKFYQEFYQHGVGKDWPDAQRRWKNASRIKFNLEIKTNPRSDKDYKGNVFNERTIDSLLFAKEVKKTIASWDKMENIQIQSFDYTPLRYIGEEASFNGDIVYLMGDFPKVGKFGDGTNLQGENGKNTPWLAGLYWPYRGTERTIAIKAQRSGGFEGMAINPKTKRLYPLLEKPLTTAAGRHLEIREYDIASQKYTEFCKLYPLHPRGQAIGDFILLDDGEHGLVIERDNSQGDLEGFKAIYKIRINEHDEVRKKEALNLLNIMDKDEVGIATKAGDVGIGKTFAFPFVTIESVVVLDNYTLGILNDNNYPFSVGRHVGTQSPDDNEFIKVMLAEPLLGNDDVR